MSIFEIILAIVFISLSVLMALVTMSALQLIKELKKSLNILNRNLEKPDSVPSLPPEPLKKFEDLLAFRSPVKPNTPPHLFRHRKP